MMSLAGSTSALFFVLATHLVAQQVEIRPVSLRSTAASETTHSPVISVTSDLVLIPVHVTNRAGVSIAGLRADSFAVFEDKVAQPIVSFGRDDAPCSIGIIFDLSGSMKTRLATAASVLRSFLETANPEDEAFLLTVSTRPGQLRDFTTDFDGIESGILGAHTGGATALNDTIAMGIEKMKHARYKNKALFVVSDGVDNHSRYTASELMRIVDEADVQIYTIGVDTWAITQKPIEVTENRNGQAFLRRLSDHSGGLNQELRDFSEAPAAAAKVSRAIREQYVIGYRPLTLDNTDKWRVIQVKVNKPQMQVSSRTGYYLR
jgi:Ca-activated chloride channel family protein